MVLIELYRGWVNLAHVEQLTTAPGDGGRWAVVAKRATPGLPLLIREYEDQPTAVAALDELVQRIELAIPGAEMVAVVRGVGT